MKNDSPHTFSKIVSYLFHPLLMPTYGLFLFFWVDSTANYFMKFETKRTLFLMTFTFTFVMPFLNALFLLRAKYIRSLHMETRAERRLPLLATAVFYMAEYYLLYDKNIPETLKMLMLSATLSVMLTVIINLFWKISAHMIGIGGITGAMFVLSYTLHFGPAAALMMILVFIAGLIGIARLQLKAHKPAEVYVGFFLGVMCPMIFLIF